MPAQEPQELRVVETSPGSALRVLVFKPVSGNRDCDKDGGLPELELTNGTRAEICWKIWLELETTMSLRAWIMALGSGSGEGDWNREERKESGWRVMI